MVPIVVSCDRAELELGHEGVGSKRLSNFVGSRTITLRCGATGVPRAHCGGGYLARPQCLRHRGSAAAFASAPGWHARLVERQMLPPASGPSSRPCPRRGRGLVVDLEPRMDAARADPRLPFLHKLLSRPHPKLLIGNLGREPTSGRRNDLKRKVNIAGSHFGGIARYERVRRARQHPIRRRPAFPPHPISIRSGSSPAIVASILSPLATGATPAGVPVKMRSPGMTSTSCER